MALYAKHRLYVMVTYVTRTLMDNILHAEVILSRIEGHHSGVP